MISESAICETGPPPADTVGGVSTLVIHAHPLDDSFSATLRDTVCDALATSGVDHRVAALCLGDQPDLAMVDHLVAVYPTWWGGPPAILLDWVQRLLSPDVDGEATGDMSPLGSIRRVTVVTTHGSSVLINNLQGEPGRQTWARVVLPRCGQGATFDWVALYKIDRTDEAQRRSFVDEVRSHFTSAAVPA